MSSGAEASPDRSAKRCAPCCYSGALIADWRCLLPGRAERHRLAKAQQRATELAATVHVVQRKLRAAAYTPRGFDPSSLFRKYTHDSDGMTAHSFVAVIRRGAKVGEEKIADQELTTLWRLLSRETARSASAPAAGRKRAPVSSECFVAFVQGELELEEQLAASPARGGTPGSAHGRSPRHQQWRANLDGQMEDAATPAAVEHQSEEGIASNRRRARVQIQLQTVA